MRDATFYGTIPGRGQAEVGPRRFWQAHDPYSPVNKVLGDAVPVVLNQGRWIACCPDCNGAQLASQTDQRFLCNECANIANGGAWRPTAWPPDRPAIEAALDRRQPANQNWVPGETVADLLAENAANGGGQ